MKLEILVNVDVRSLGEPVDEDECSDEIMELVEEAIEETTGVVQVGDEDVELHLTVLGIKISHCH
jgi:hypothetical protein